MGNYNDRKSVVARFIEQNGPMNWATTKQQRKMSTKSKIQELKEEKDGSGISS